MAVIKKLINKPENILEEMLDGFVYAYDDRIQKLDGYSVIVRKEKKKNNKVGLVIGNGAGHEPAVIGWVGHGMLDANAIGDIFSAPGPDTIYEAVKSSDHGNGVVLLVSNHAGDVLNSQMAMNMLKEDGYKVEEVILYDDIASAPKEFIEERRGAIGTLFNYKITGAYAEQESDIKAVKKMAEKVRDNTRSISLGINPGTSPLTGEKMFDIAEDEVELGMGVHGEAAMYSGKIKPVDELVDDMFDMLKEDLSLKPHEEILVIVNGNGSTTLMELMIFYRRIKQIADKANIKIFKPLIGEFITTQEMAGVSLAICRADDELKKLWAAPTNVPYFPY